MSHAIQKYLGQNVLPLSKHVYLIVLYLGMNKYMRLSRARAEYKVSTCAPSRRGCTHDAHPEVHEQLACIGLDHFELVVGVRWRRIYF